MQFGSETHKELFCRSFIDSHLEYEPEQIPWTALDVTYQQIQQGKGNPLLRSAHTLWHYRAVP